MMAMTPDLCGCCAPTAPRTPILVTNRPGLSAIAYRIGTFAAFRQAMLEAIAGEPALHGLTVRQSDDPAITVLELWAAVADILTFYQERIANEAYLRTARERDSVLRLAGLLDYHLRPGLAATARLAFTVDEGASVRIPVGLRVMSVPGQDEQPQFFETVEAFTADARLNRLPILPQPVSANPFGFGEQSLLLTADEAGIEAARTLRPSDHVLLFRLNAATPPEEKEVKEIRIEGDRHRLVWTSPIVQTGWPASTSARAFSGKMRLFGYDAPHSYLSAQHNPAAADPANRVVWSTFTVHPVGLSSNILPLDGIHKEIAVGDRLLLYEAGGGDPPLLLEVQQISEGEQILEKAGYPLPPASLADHRHRATVTSVTVSSSVSVFDRRAVTIYHLKGPDLPVWPRQFPPAIDSGRLYVPAILRDPATQTVEIGRRIEGQEVKAGVQLRPDEIELGRTVLLVDHAHPPVPAAIVAREVTDPAIDGQRFLVLEVVSPADILLDAGSATLLGNVARSTHGETVSDEIVGDGDAAVAFQRFTLRKRPLTYVPSPRSSRGESSLRLMVNGERWEEAETLYGQPPTARAYTARQSDDGTTVLQFGDGATGARLPTGRANVIATYRQGLGRQGRMKADQLSITLDRPVGLKAVTNPAPTDGGVDPERLDQARQAAPTTVKTFGRAVSLLDFASLATASGEVAKAAATWVWRGLEKAVHLTVAAPDGEPFSAEALTRLHAALTQHRDPNHPLLIGNLCRIPIVLRATVQVEARFERDVVAGAARAALQDYFAFDRMDLARPVHLSDLYRLLQDVPGVLFVDIDELHFKGYASWTAVQLAARAATASPVQAHLRIFAARAHPGGGGVIDPLVLACFAAQPLPEVFPAEQAYVQSSEDITITAEGGLR